jgi:hypothetical protein
MFPPLVQEIYFPILFLLVDLPGFEPGLFGTKTQRVTNYTKGQYFCKDSNKYDISK